MEQVMRAFICSGGTKVKGGIGTREPNSFQGNLQEAHPLWEETLQIDRVNKAHGVQTRLGFLREADDQGG